MRDRKMKCSILCAKDAYPSTIFQMMMMMMVVVVVVVVIIVVVVLQNPLSKRTNFSQYASC